MRLTGRDPAGPRALLWLTAGVSLAGAAPGYSGAPEPTAPPKPRAKDKGPELSFECKNPLFQNHWYAPDLDVAHMVAQPAAYSDLERCKMWNLHSSCCNPAMEGPQQNSFDAHREGLEQKVQMYRVYLDALNNLRTSEVYQKSDKVEQGLLDRAMASFKPTLEKAKQCMEAIMVFAAGMICFGCNPNWDQFVWRDHTGLVTRIHVAGESCVYVDQYCGVFGRHAENLRIKVMESTLAKVPSSPLPDFSMFKDRISTCDWLRDFAMQPFPSFRPVSFARAEEAAKRDLPQVRRPVVRRLAESAGPPIEELDRPRPPMEELDRAERRLAESAGPPMEELDRPTSGPQEPTAEPPTTPAPTAPPFATEPTHLLDPVRDGRQSGFHFDDVLSDESAGKSSTLRI